MGRVAYALEGRGFASFQWPAGFVGAEGAQVQQAQALSHYLAGLLAEGLGEFDAAQREYSQARRYDPEESRVAVRLGAIYMRLNDLPQARNSFQEASRITPADPLPRFFLGVLLANEGRLDEAALQYREVLDQDPSNLSALGQLADLYVVQEKLQEGLVIYEKFLTERPDSPVAHFNIGVLYAKLERWKEAIHHFRQSVEMDPANFEARLALGVSLEKAEDLPGAKEQFLKAMELEPTNTRLSRYLARLCYQMGNLEEASSWLSRYLSFNPRDAAAYVELAYLRLEQGRWKDGIPFIKLAIELGNFEEPPVEIWLALGMAYQIKEDYRDAEAIYRQVAAMVPQDMRAFVHLGAMYHRLHRFEEAERVYRDAFRINPDDPQVLNGLGYLYVDWGIRLEEAEVLIRRALFQDPQNSAYLDSLGWAYFRRGRFQGSLEFLQEALLENADPEIFEHLGQVYLSLKDGKAAKAAWEKALKLKPKDSRLIRQLELELRNLRKDR